MKRLATVLLYIPAFAMGIVSPSATSWINGHEIVRQQPRAAASSAESPQVPAVAVKAALAPRAESKKLAATETSGSSREARIDSLFPGSFQPMTSHVSSTLVLHELAHQSHHIRTDVHQPVRGDSR